MPQNQHCPFQLKTHDKHIWCGSTGTQLLEYSQYCFRQENNRGLAFQGYIIYTQNISAVLLIEKQFEMFCVSDSSTGKVFRILARHCLIV